ncbi:GDSL-type esterase/lipase family protein [Alicyclobacillus fodiniaquatilis]|uniref:GDSL-type esterase/lipase family protein n=1 Tax=Alicyclobacillus fodiniaquatilis TaxID=1661150 RepID=A0ABW4JCQ6_9BACL
MLITNYKILNRFAKKGQILFVGSSLMEQFPIHEMQHTLALERIIYNRGIGGFVTADLLQHMEVCIFELEPTKMFINIGTNDIASADGDYSLSRLVSNYDNILTQISGRLSNCKVYVMAYYPVNADADFPGIDVAQKSLLFKTRTNSAIREANEAIEELALQHGCEFIDVNEGLFDEQGNLRAEYSVDGIHMWANGYAVILGNLLKYL